MMHTEHMTTKTDPFTRTRRTGKCSYCKRTLVWVGIFQTRCDCDTLVKGKAIAVRHSDTVVCDAKCYNAKSDGCTCSCDGENHGKAHEARGVLL